MVMGMDGAHLRAGDYSGSPIGGHKVTLATVGSGSKEEIDKIWEKGSAAARTITAGKFDYKAHDPSYEVGTDGGRSRTATPWRSLWARRWVSISTAPSGTRG